MSIVILFVSCQFVFLVWGMTSLQAADLSVLDDDTRQSIELACINAKVDGPASYRQCIQQQLESLQGIGVIPDLAVVDDDTRQSIELACINAKVNGPASYRICVHQQLESLQGVGAMPDLAGVDDDTRQSIELACINSKVNGPAPYRMCIEQHLASIRGIGAMPDLSDLDDDTRQSMELACINSKVQGPVVYRNCIQQQLESLGAMPNRSNRTIGSSPVITVPEPATKSSPTMAPSSKRSAPQLTQMKLPAWSGSKPPMPRNVSTSAAPPSAIFERLTQSVYKVLASSDGTFSDDDQISQGSAVAISARNLLTNCHIIQDSAAVLVIKGEAVMPVHVSNADLSTDRCFLTLVGNESLVPVSGVRAFSTLAVGERVFSIGSPRGLENTLGEGLISGLREDHDIRFIQTSASISPGSSGGGLFDESGNLIGLTTFLLRESQNLNFAISAEDYWR